MINLAFFGEGRWRDLCGESEGFAPAPGELIFAISRERWEEGLIFCVDDFCGYSESIKHGRLILESDRQNH